MKKYLLFFALLAGSFSDLLAQRVVLEQEVSQDSVPQTTGPNRKHFSHVYAGFGFIAGPAEAKGSEIEYFNSHEIVLGYRYKFRVSNFYAMGFDVAFSSQTFKIKQQFGKNLPSPYLNDEEKLRFTNLGGSVYNRFNYGKRGNYVGNFLDLGVYGNWTPFKIHLYENDYALPNSIGAKAVKVRESGLKYVASTQYGVLARLGFNRYVIFGNYRLSDLFNTGYKVTNEQGVNVFDFAELPRLTIGLQIGMHQ